jgi:hypothetical protein
VLVNVVFPAAETISAIPLKINVVGILRLLYKLCSANVIIDILLDPVSFNTTGSVIIMLAEFYLNF